CMKGTLLSRSLSRRIHEPFLAETFALSKKTFRTGRPSWISVQAPLMCDLCVAHLKNDAALLSSVHIRLRRRRGVSTDLPCTPPKRGAFTVRIPRCDRRKLFSALTTTNNLSRFENSCLKPAAIACSQQLVAAKLSRLFSKLEPWI